MDLFHPSTPVRDPRRVADALAKLVDGATYEFPHPGCYSAGEPNPESPMTNLPGLDT